VCICTVFNKLPFVERIAKVKESGLPAFEFWGWNGLDLDAVVEAKRQTGLDLAAICVDSSDPAMKQAWPKGILVNPEMRPVFVAAARESIQVAQKLGCRTLIATVGNEQPGLSPWQMHDSIVEGLRAVAAEGEKAGVTFVLEPLNTLVNHKGYYLWSSKEGFDICRAVGSPAVKLLFDIYHQQIMEGNLIQNITQSIGLVGHFHSADVPGRHEYGTGEINYANVLRRIDEAGYTGYVGLEYSPTGDSAASLARIKEIVGLG
jgi:hydroxypyruvate isomerase